MRTLTYSPSVEIYVCHIGYCGERTYYDMTQDIVSCSVSSSIDATGTLSATFQNPGNKYAGKIAPMDLVCAYATKVGKVRLFTGYVTSCTEFCLYPSDFTIKAMDATYRLNKLYWDANLYTSFMLVQKGKDDITGTMRDAGLSIPLYLLLTRVAGMDKGMVHIGDVPQNIEALARKMWSSQAESAKEATSMQRDFMSALANVPFGVKGATTPGPSNQVGTIPSNWGGKADIVNAALQWLGTPYDPGGTEPYVGMDCSGLVCCAYKACGYDLQAMGARTADEIKGLPGIEIDESQAKPGDLLFWYGQYSGYGRDYPYWFHVAIYMGDGQIVEEPAPGDSCRVRDVYDMGWSKTFYHLSILDG